MSIEQKIEDLTKAVRELTAAMSNSAVEPARPATVVENVKAVEKAKKEEPKAEKPKAEKPKAEKEALDYSTYIQKPALNLVAVKGRPALTAILSEYGVGNAKEVPEPQWPELRAKIDAVMAVQEEQV
jgi:type II secretory pathway component GspD/PulD (secretin)